ncbi:uncharacterized protein B0H64DRAFT_235860 [Chaetomium fimeti]|uniref:Uncharacterized protein n=1 Tax=Chaetomium fimeti TaxID=1854472 RepID=A0AAE0LPK8_9PEZI|nr:hypothetical protein B0H64DRAFT_235860 [Chaetomium fimeti]
MMSADTGGQLGDRPRRLLMQPGCLASHPMRNLGEPNAWAFACAEEIPEQSTTPDPSFPPGPGHPCLSGWGGGGEPERRPIRGSTGGGGCDASTAVNGIFLLIFHLYFSRLRRVPLRGPSTTPAAEADHSRGWLSKKTGWSCGCMPNIQMTNALLILSSGSQPVSLSLCLFLLVLSSSVSFFGLICFRVFATHGRGNGPRGGSQLASGGRPPVAPRSPAEGCMQGGLLHEFERYHSCGVIYPSLCCSM